MLEHEKKTSKKQRNSEFKEDGVAMTVVEAYVALQ